MKNRNLKGMNLSKSVSYYPSVINFLMVCY